MIKSEMITSEYLQTIKELASLYNSKQLKKKDINKMLDRNDLKIFNKYLELLELQHQKKINRKIFRVCLHEYILGLELQQLKLDYIRDIVNLYKNVVAYRKTASQGELNSNITHAKIKKYYI